MEGFLERIRHVARAAWRPVATWWENRRAGKEAAERLDPDRRLREARQDHEPDAGAEVLIVRAGDDVASLTGRLETATRPEVVLVVRRDARALRNPAAWPHLAAQARRRGITLGVVSSRRDVRAYARGSGLRAASSASGLRRRGPVRVAFGGRSVPLPQVPWSGIVRAGVLLLGVSAVAVVACYQVPSATIELSPVSSEISAEMSLRPSPLVEASDVTSGVIRATTVRETIETTLATATSGETEIGDEPAHLDLRFTNDGDNEAVIPVGTRVTDEGGVGFLTDEELAVPAGESAEVGATAEFPGEAGNVGIGTVSAPNLPAGVIVTNTSRGAGGTNKAVPAVAQEDVDRIHAIADDVLRRIGERTLEARVTSGAILPGTVTVAVFSEQPEQQLGEPADALIVDYTIIATALMLSESERADIGEQMLRRAIPVGQALLPGTSTVDIVESPPDEGAAGAIRLRAHGSVVPLAGLSDLSDSLTGIRPGAAAALLEAQLRLAEPPRITLNPSFLPWRWLPRRADRIEIRLVAPGSDSPETEASGETAPEATTTPEATTGG